MGRGIMSVTTAPQWSAWPDASAAAAACAECAVSAVSRALAGKGDATVAFSGGSTPLKMFASLAEAHVDWTRVQVFFVDERCVPPDHPDSNYGSVRKHLLDPCRIPVRNVHRMQGELPPDQAARLYEGDVREVFGLSSGDLPYFDFIHLGMGADCHTASLFPGDVRVHDQEGIAAAVPAAGDRTARITLLPGVLLRARNIAVLVAGADKAEPLHRVFHAPVDMVQMPAQLVARSSRKTNWFLDEPAASKLK
ncbi:MAG TPA: 6-phosphogluconolactonase [Bryobacteraceae bacterium]|nr:6-phosphogluconolactonase [Bryobacteraceae bacterium]